MTCLRLFLALRLSLAGAERMLPLDADDALSLLQVSGSKWPNRDPVPEEDTSIYAWAGNTEERPDPPPVPQRVLWINAFARSGSSVLMSLVSQVDFPVFALFEPCKDEDELEPWLAAKGCRGLLSQLAHCNFTGVNNLHGWDVRYTLRNGAKEEFSPHSAEVACKSAGLVVFKTITWGHDLAKEAIPFLKANTHVQAINLVRDPRSIYASMHTAEDFYADPNRGYFAEELTEMCDQMYKGMKLSHPRMINVVYEKFVAAPRKTAESIFSFMAIPAKLGHPAYKEFIRDSFNADHCEEEGSYGDCKEDSTKPVDRYRTLPPDMLGVFKATKSCRELSEFYGYTLAVTPHVLWPTKRP